ncbi:hypothetical protein YWY31_23170 [Paenibacillus illinoisensis]|uniref:hypothetical protein n=1 Tax=Paenibacillus illinoisensis TaxID=59845 RepID=UPI0034C0A740
MLKPKLPALLNGVRILLSFKMIFYIITFIVFVSIFSRNPEAYLDPPITGSDLGDVSAELTARIMFWDDSQFACCLFHHPTKVQIHCYVPEYRFIYGCIK